MMEIALLFPFSLFFYLISVLLAAAATRAESRFSLFWSRQTYCAGLALTAAVLASRFANPLRGSDGSFFEGMLLSAGLLGIIYFVMLVFFRLELEAGFFAAVSLVLGLVAEFKVDFGLPVARPLEGNLSSHAVFMFLALAAFSLSFIFSLFYLIGDSLLKRKRIDSFVLKLPSLELISRLNFSFLTIGTASLLGGVIAGLIDLSMPGADQIKLPVSTIGLSALTLLLYGVVLFVRIGPLERRRSTAFVSIACYACMLVTVVAAHSGGGFS